MSTAPYNKGDKVVCMAAWHADHEVVGAVRTVASCEQSRITGKWYIRLVELVDPSPSHNYDAARYRPARTTDYPAPQPAGAGEQSLRNAFSVWAETQGNGEVSLLDVLSPIEAEAAFDNWKLTLVAAAPKAAPAPAPVSGEADPTGRSAHEAGAKLDSGKLRPALVLGGFANALLAVTKVGTDGANKYTDNGWRAVPNGLTRYEDALHRHLLKHQSGEKVDPDSGSTHLAHVAWNALALIELTKAAE